MFDVPFPPSIIPLLPMYADNEFLPLSGLQHLLFCPRQCALIHIERLWEENRFTAEGRILHERADTPGSTSKGGIRTVRSLPLRSTELGLSGVADVVEFRPDGPYPVEYKRGRPKKHRADEIQLCAQALCLEEMFGQRIPEGALFYGKAKRRKTIVLGEDLRALARDLAHAFHELVRRGTTPPPDYEARKCGSCSLVDLCLPRQGLNNRRATSYVDALYHAEDGGDTE
jgi:CRISPR-associated exonuclease Cas4